MVASTGAKYVILGHRNVVLTTVKQLRSWKKSEIGFG